MMVKKIHIAHIIPALPYGGAERCVVDIINNTDAARFKFSVIIFKNNAPMAEEIAADAEVFVVEKIGKLGWGLAGEIEKKLREIGADIVHTHLWGGDFWGRLAARRAGLPVITTEHNLNYGEGWLKNFIKKLMKNYSEKYVACSEAVREYMRVAYGTGGDDCHSRESGNPVTGCHSEFISESLSTNRQSVKILKQVQDDKNEKCGNDSVEVIMYGINLERFINLPEPAFGKPLRFLMIGRLSAQKGHAVALRALAGLKEYDWNLKIVGEGDLKDELVELVKNLSLDERVIFDKPSSAVPEFFENSDIFLMPSLWEGLGIVVMEAMAAGRPVIASRVGGLPELIKDGETGFLVEANHADILEKKLRWCFENLDKYSEIGRKARIHAENNFGIKKAVVEYEKIYSSL